MVRDCGLVVILGDRGLLEPPVGWNRDPGIPLCLCRQLLDYNLESYHPQGRLLSYLEGKPTDANALWDLGLNEETIENF